MVFNLFSSRSTVTAITPQHSITLQRVTFNVLIEVSYTSAVPLTALTVVVRRGITRIEPSIGGIFATITFGATELVDRYALRAFTVVPVFVVQADITIMTGTGSVSCWIAAS